jgi:diacylglycerol kinase
MSEPSWSSDRSWARKFADAFRGIYVGVRGQGSFAVHFAATVIVVGLAAWLQVSVSQWCLLVLCIAIVLAAELFNSCLEMMGKAISKEYDADIRNALDAASGAVLLAAIGAATVGILIFLPQLLQQFS